MLHPSVRLPEIARPSRLQAKACIGAAWGLVLALLVVPQVPRPAAAQISVAGGAVQVATRAIGQYGEVAQGAQQTIAVVMDHAPGFHSWPNTAQLVIPEWLGDGFFPIETRVDSFETSPGLTVHETGILWPAPEAVPVDYLNAGTKQDLLSFKGRAVILVPVNVAADAPLGEARVGFKLTYQSCDETTCYPPEEPSFAVTFKVVAAGSDFMASQVPDPDAIFTTAAEQGVKGPAGAAGVTFNLFGWRFEVASGGLLGLLSLLLLAALGGLLLNFTPCVLPVLPIKIMGMSRAAGDPRRLIVLGIVMSLGVVAFWMVIGGAIAFVTGFSAISSLFQTSWFSLVVGLFVAVMAMGMLGLFDIVLPQAVYRYQPQQETLPGAFGFGIMTAVLSTPCTAPFMGTAAAWAARQTPAITLTTFGAIGAGMALPYLLLSLRPGLLGKVPRTGPASNVLKQVMGLLMLAVASFFLGIPIAAALRQAPAPASRAYWWIVAAFAVAACAWMLWRSLQLTQSPLRRAFFAGTAIIGAVTMLAITPSLTSHGPIDWVYYTPEKLAAVQADGKVAVIDFTAEWCLNCKALEKSVLHRPEVVERLASAGVVPVKVDLTGDNPEGRALLQRLDSVGIPFLAVLGPGTGFDEKPLTFDSYTVQAVLDAIDAADG